MTEGFYCCQKSYGNTTGMKNSATIKKFQFHFRSKLNKSPEKISLKIGYKIPWTYVLLILKFFDPHQQSYGFKMFFVNGVFVRRPEKSRFKSAEISAASNMGVGRYC